jgi:hypothetical protein
MTQDRRLSWHNPEEIMCGHIDLLKVKPKHSVSVLFCSVT